MAMNLPISISTYVQERPDLKNRQQRRAKVIRSDLPAANWGSRQAAQISPPLPTLPSVASTASAGDRSDAMLLADSSLTQAVLLDWLGQQPIAFHRIYVDITGSVTAAVWLSLVLSRMASSSVDHIDAEGIHQFTLAKYQCETETGLTEAEQRKAHRQLVNAGVLSVSYPRKNEKFPGKTPSPTFKLDLRKLTSLLIARSEGLAEMVRHSAALASSLDIQALERQAQARAVRRSA